MRSNQQKRPSHWKAILDVHLCTLRACFISRANIVFWRTRYVSFLLSVFRLSSRRQLFWKHPLWLRVPAVVHRLSMPSHLRCDWSARAFLSKKECNLRPVMFLVCLQTSKRRLRAERSGGSNSSAVDCNETVNLTLKCLSRTSGGPVGSGWVVPLGSCSVWCLYYNMIENSRTRALFWCSVPYVHESATLLCNGPL